MADAVITIRGETYITLESVAECFEFELNWVRRVCDLGLVGPTEPVAKTLAIPTRMLDRIAEIRRLELQYGFDLELIEIFLQTE